MLPADSAWNAATWDQIAPTPPHPTTEVDAISRLLGTAPGPGGFELLRPARGSRSFSAVGA
ncbi:hypothetical protein DSC45_34345 [Streptomyces sp. YIM 130001]|nr:hypothetical protein DSC45_34345 [Streptomyces sp. YIM 130001]